MVDRSEFRRGIAEARGFILSHHVPAERYRCYAPVLFGHRIHLCARCSGIYPGIAGGVLAWFLAPSAFTGFLLVALLPLPALVDWALTTFTDRRGYNVVRTATGSLLGYGYGLGLALLLADRYLSVLLVGITYAFAAVVLLYFSEC